ncbi:unnamed protein product [Musa hybrid cultivar]
MGESLLTALSMDHHHHHHHHHPSTLLSMDPSGVSQPSLAAASAHDDYDHELLGQQRPQITLSGPPDINLPLAGDRSPPQQSWNPVSCDMLDVRLGTQVYDADTALNLPKVGIIPAGGRKCAKRGDSIWGAWFFFNFYFKPVLSEKFKGKIIHDANGFSGFDKSDLCPDVFLVQHDMENMYMWVFKERPENALGKMQLRSYMNGHSRLGEPQFPFSVDKGFARSHRMQRKQYRGLSNPQCVHGIEVVWSPNLSMVSEADCKKWVDLLGRDLNFSIPPEASDFGSWRNLPSTDFELERPPPPLKNTSHLNSRKLLNGTGLNLSTQPSHAGGDCMDFSPKCSKRRKDFFPHGTDEDCCLSNNSYCQDMEIRPAEPSWVNEFTGVMRHACGPVTAAKTIYEDEEGYLIMVSLPFSDQQKVKVSWKNNLTRGIVKISCVSTARMPYIKRHDRTFKLTDPSPEHCPPGEFVREIPLATRIPEDANLEAYYDETGTVLEIMIPKHRVGSEEHEVHVCMRPPHLGSNELLLAFMGIFSLVTGLPGPSGFGSSSTAEQVTEGVDASNLTVIITGGASGIGAETARVFALRGAHVIIAARNMEAATDAKQLILKTTPSARVDLLELDLSSLKSVRAFSDKFLSMDLPLNILINNAGVMFCPHQLSEDGTEMQFATNHIGHFQLTNLLLEKMKSTARKTGIEGRIVNLSSVAHIYTYEDGIRFSELNEKYGYSSKKAYGQSKLANILHANELSRRLQEEGANVTVNSVHPGLIMTNLMRHTFFLMRMLKMVSYILWKNVPQGAATTCYVALHPSVKGVSGKYFVDCNEAKPSSLAGDETLARRLWDFSEKLVKAKSCDRR